MTSHLAIPALAIFDMDGLIFDTERLFMTTKDGVMKEYGYTQQKDDYIHTLGTCGQQLLDILHRLYGDDYPAEEISQKCRTLVTEKIRRDGPPVKPGIPELLAWFASNNIPCCVASSTKHDIVVEYLRLAKLDKYFAYVIGGDQVQRSKPNPDIFSCCLSTYGYQTGTCTCTRGFRKWYFSGIQCEYPGGMYPGFKSTIGRNCKKNCRHRT